MKIEGTHTIQAPPERVYEVLTDSGVLSRCLPGAEKLELVGENTYDLAISAGVGAIKGKYSGTVRLKDLKPPTHYRMVVDVKGKTGFVKGEGVVDLKAEGEGTLVAYSGTVQLGGPVAAVGQRLHKSTAKMMTRQVFGALAAEATAAPGEEVKHGFIRDFRRGGQGR